VSRPIQVIPPGLLGFLQLKNSGQAPAELPDTLQGVLELRDWYFQARLVVSNQIHGGSAATAVFGFQAYSPNTIVVPEREYWWVENYSFTSDTIPAGDLVTARAAYIVQASGATRPFLLGDQPPAPPGFPSGQYRLAVSASRFFLGPGSVLGFYIDQNTRAAGNTSFIGNVRYAALPI